jgi:hypothetical protein
MPMPLRSHHELRAASDHLGYEVWMLRKAAAKLRLIQPGADRNAVLESFTIHARALRQFFEPTKPKPDDVLAWHYVGDQLQWQKARGRMPAVLADINGRVGTEIAHLSYRRLKFGPVAEQWNISASHDALMQVLTKFVAAVPTANLSDKFHELTAPALMLTLDVDRLVTLDTNTPTMVNSITAHAAYRSLPSDDDDAS